MFHLLKSTDKFMKYSHPGKLATTFCCLPEVICISFPYCQASPRPREMPAAFDEITGWSNTTDGQFSYFIATELPFSKWDWIGMYRVSVHVYVLRAQHEWDPLSKTKSCSDR